MQGSVLDNTTPGLKVQQKSYGLISNWSPLDHSPSITSDANRDSAFFQQCTCVVANDHTLEYKLVRSLSE